MISIDQLKEIVLRNVEESGQMDYIRAQLKLQVYKIIEAQDNKEQAGFQWEHPLHQLIHKTQDGLSALELIVEFLEYYKLDYTSQVLRKEAHLVDPIIRPRLAKKIGISGKEDSLKPLLLTLIVEYMKCIEEGVPVAKKPQQKANEPQVDEETKQKQKELEWKREQERKRVEELKKKEEDAKKKEEEKMKKQQAQRPQTAPPEQQKKDTGGPVNKIRGAGKMTGMSGNLTNLYGIDSSNKPSNDIDNYAFDLDSEPKDPYSFDIAGKNGKKDPYAFDLNSKSNDPYAFDLDDPKKKKNNDPYAFDFDEPKKTSVDQSKKNKFNSNAYDFDIDQPAKPNKRAAIKEEIDEDIDFTESKDDRQKQSNNMFTSSEDYMRATQSLGVDESVDSLALEEYDYYEDVNRKR